MSAPALRSPPLSWLYNHNPFYVISALLMLYSVRSDQLRESVRKIVGDVPVYVCDVQQPEQIEQLRDDVARDRRGRCRDFAVDV